MVGLQIHAFLPHDPPGETCPRVVECGAGLPCPTRHTRCVHVERLPDASTFLVETRGYRAHEPLRTNVLGSVATAASMSNAPGEASWWVVRAADGEVVGASARTPPFDQVVGPMPPEAASSLGRTVAAEAPGLPGAVGPAACVRAFLAECATGSSSTWSSEFAHQRNDVLYELVSLHAPEGHGRCAPASDIDLNLAVEWLGAFAQEIDGEHHGASVDDERRRALDVIRAGRLHLWHDDGAVVAMAGHNLQVETTETVTRVGPVYTPPARRRRGFGACVTAAVSQRLLDRGDRVMLFADAANPTSNGVYQALGYQAIDRYLAATRKGRHG
jgi:GNAT superfamily N-acetyltransferase